MTSLNLEQQDEWSDSDFDRMGDLGLELFYDLQSQAEEIAEEENSDDVGILFNVYIGLIHLLASCGWTPEELAKEALEHGRQELEPQAGNA